MALALALGVSLSARADNAKSYIEHIPQRIAGCAIGTLVGTPIALVRCTKRELVKQTKEAYTLGGMPKPLGYITSGFFGVPSGIMCGVWYGTFDGAIDGYVNSKDTMFNKGTFSLDKLEY
jgi:hypothetical protein